MSFELNPEVFCDKKRNGTRLALYNQQEGWKMNTFETIEEARDYAASKHRVTHIVEIEPGRPGINAYICLLCNAQTFSAEISRKPMPEIKRVIRDVVDIESERKVAQATKDLATLSAAIASGEAFRVAEITDQYGAELTWARHSKPGDGYAEWVVFGYSGDAEIKVSPDAIRQVIGTRKSVGSFPGCSNTAWEITAEEWDQIIALDAKIKIRKAAAKTRMEAAESEDIKSKIGSGYCFHCEGWCYGDCGHYTNNPMVKLRRDAKQANREANCRRGVMVDERST